MRITQIDHLKGYQQSIISFLTESQLSQNLKNGHKAFVNSACELKIIIVHGEISFLEFLKGQFWNQLFIIYLCDIDVASYADDTTPYLCGVTLDSTVKSLEKAADLSFTWFNYNQMKGNEDKCHVKLGSQDNVHVNIGTAQIEKLLGVNIDSKLTLEDHINRNCKKACAKLNALRRISYYMDPLKLLVNAFLHPSFITVLLTGCLTVED